MQPMSQHIMFHKTLKKEPKKLAISTTKTIPMIFFGNLDMINLLKYRYVIKCQLCKLTWMFVFGCLCAR